MMMVGLLAPSSFFKEFPSVLTFKGDIKYHQRSIFSGFRRRVVVLSIKNLLGKQIYRITYNCEAYDGLSYLRLLRKTDCK